MKLSFVSWNTFDPLEIHQNVLCMAESLMRERLTTETMAYSTLKSVLSNVPINIMESIEVAFKTAVINKRVNA